MKRVLLILIIFITGCSKYNDLNELIIIKSISISYNQKYYINAQIIKSIDENNNPKMKIIESSGNTISESFDNLKKLINKKTYLSHIDLMVLNKNLTNNNYDEIINYFIQNNDFRNDFYCIFSTDPKLLLEKTGYDEIEIFLKTSEKNQKITIKIFDDVIKEFIDNSEITLPDITYHNEILYKNNYKYKKKENNNV